MMLQQWNTMAALLAALSVFSCDAFNVQNAHLTTRTAARFYHHSLVLWEGRKDEARALAQRFVDALMKAPIYDIPDSDGMKYMSNIPDLETNEDYSNIVIRKMTDAFWDKCIELVDTPGERYRVAAIGRPGIGKTTSTTLLIRKLLSTDNTVVYLVRTKEKTGWFYEFVSKGEKYTAEVYPERAGWDRVESLMLRSTYYIVDPGTSEGPPSCNEDSDFLPKLIIVSSPDKRHWGGRGFLKDRGIVAGFLEFFPDWSEDELIAAQPIIRPDMTKEQVMERYEMFGGSARYVFAKESRVKMNLGLQEMECLPSDEYCCW
jgi:hypothetical protein